MDKLIFESYERLVEKMLKIADSGKEACVICFFDEAVEILKKLMSNDQASIGAIHVFNPEYDCYDKEYYISIDKDYVICAEPAWHEANEYHEAGYYIIEASDVFIDGDANSAILKKIISEKCYEIEFNLQDDIDDDDFYQKLFDNAKIISDKNGNPIGIGIDIRYLFL